MANFAIVNLGFKADKLRAMLNAAQKGNGWINIDLFVSEDTDDYGNNVSAIVQQSKEERESGAKRNYVANGKVRFVSEGFQITKAGEAPLSESEVDPLDDVF